jgi:phospholipase C
MHKSFVRRLGNQAVVTSTILALLAAQSAGAQIAPNDANTTSPIKHVIVIIGENRSFDHVFATYQPPAGQSILNLQSEGIVRANGEQGPNFHRRTSFGQPVQYLGYQPGDYTINPTKIEPYESLPAPGSAGAPFVASDTNFPPFATLAAAANFEFGLYPGDLALITTGATGLSGFDVPDTRITNDADLPDGPFQLTGPHLPYDSYSGSPVHRFYQMWQETDCSAAHATVVNPTGCLSDLFPFDETTVSTGSDTKSPPTGYNPQTYRNVEGSTAMAYFNMAQGDVPYFKQLAQQYTISDNFHQSVMGGTGANHIMFGFGDMIYFSNPDFTMGKPPTGQIENPNSQPGTNNFWVNDGYGSSATNAGGSFTTCADTTQAGVPAIVDYLTSVGVKSNCATGAYYLLNNYNPAYVGNGTLDPAINGPFTLPPVNQRHIGDDLDAGQVSWAYFGEDWNEYVSDPDPNTNPAGYLYCNICNPFQYSSQTMTNTTERTTHIQDTANLYADLQSGNLPAVSIVKPGALNDGHPASSKLDLFESFTHKIIADLQANPALFATTAVFITFDEGGGYWDSGYIQPLDYFGDGTRMPLIVVSPFATGGVVNHSYGDHVSLDKFIERNWSLGPITSRSRDNLPNPVATAENPYVPTNRPAIDDLFDLFNFQ